MVFVFFFFPLSSSIVVIIDMKTFRSLALISLVLISVNGTSVLGRYFNEEDGVPLARTALEDARVSDADVGMKSDLFIGTFGGRPIITRQENTFIDQDGVPVPMLPYHEKYHGKFHNAADHHTSYQRFMERSRGAPQPL
ncbi:unnamed protein product [Caenorhabditis sp. 36 PRJEB53466]|nr:unnamed protein product [Caenorhabditis sp. 36 PRJEB53466]